MDKQYARVRLKIKGIPQGYCIMELNEAAEMVKDDMLEPAGEDVSYHIDFVRMDEKDFSELPAFAGW